MAAMPETEQIVCPCGSHATPVDMFQTPTRRYVRCPDCELVFLNPRPLGTLVEEFYREDYDEAYGEAEASSDRHPVFESVVRRLAPVPATSRSAARCWLWRRRILVALSVGGMDLLWAGVVEESS